MDSKDLSYFQLLHSNLELDNYCVCSQKGKKINHRRWNVNFVCHRQIEYYKTIEMIPYNFNYHLEN